jgi:hypothetical protein
MSAENLPLISCVIYVKGRIFLIVALIDPLPVIKRIPRHAECCGITRHIMD